MSDHKLHFSKDGRFLFHGSYASVRVWHDRMLVKELPGKLVGTSLDGKILIIYHQQFDRFSAWQSATGTPLPTRALHADQFAPNQRYYIKQKRLTLTFLDGLGQDPPQEYTFEDLTNTNCDNWSLSPDGKLLAVAFFFDIGGHDGAFGRCYEIDKRGQMQIAFKFEVDRFISTPVVDFCELYSALAVSTPDAISLFLSNGHKVDAFSYGTGGGKFIAVSPQRAMSVMHQTHSTWRLYRGSDRREVKEPRPILACAFRPDGQQIAFLLEDQSIRIYESETVALLAELSVPKLLGGSLTQS